MQHEVSSFYRILQMSTSPFCTVEKLIEGVLFCFLFLCFVLFCFVVNQMFFESMPVVKFYSNKHFHAKYGQLDCSQHHVPMLPGFAIFQKGKHLEAAKLPLLKLQEIDIQKL